MSWTLFTDSLPGVYERYKGDWISKPIYLLKTDGSVEESYARVFDNVLHAIARHRQGVHLRIDRDEMLAWAYCAPPEIPDNIKELIK